MAGYTPSYEHGLANPNVSGPLGTDTGGGSTPWEAAPPKSHVYRWRWFDNRVVKFLRKFPSPIGQGRSELHVQFRNEDGSPSSTYAYFFDSPEAGITILEKLRGSSHPFSEVVHPLLIVAKVPYTRVHN